MAAVRVHHELGARSLAGQALGVIGRDQAVTSSVRDEWPKAHQVPYLVSVADPYDYLSPRHVWATRLLTASRIGSVLGLRSVRDAVVVRNS